MKICTKCNKEWPDEYMACPIDLTPLVASPRQPTGYNLNLTEANVCGGVNLSDNHSVSNNTVNTTTSNVDSHNVITNNITHVEREKSPEEIKHEKELAFREECIKVYSNGIMTSDGKRKLEDLQYSLGLNESDSSRIIAEVAKRTERKSTSLSPVHQITFNNIKTAINANRLDLVNRLMAQMNAIVQRYSVEEIQFTYYMLQAILHPKECIVEYERHHEDKYWQSFWSSIAYRRLGNIEKSELLVADVDDKWTDTIPHENVFILAAINAILEKDFDTAKRHYDNISGEYSQYLSNIVTCIYTLLYENTLVSEDLEQWQKDCVFYTNNLFTEINTFNLEHKDTNKEEKNSNVTTSVTKNELPFENNPQAETLYAEACATSGPKRVMLLQKAADAGALEAMYDLSDCYCDGEGIGKNMDLAISWLTKAADLGLPKAQTALGALYMTGAEGHEQNYAVSEKYLTMAAERDFPKAQLALSFLYIEMEEYGKALMWARKAAAFENEAYTILGQIYLYGLGVNKDETEGLKYYEKAAIGGDADAQNTVGNLFSNKNSGWYNLDNAFKYYQMAAAQNHIYGMFNFGLCYADGDGCIVDIPKALEWIEKAANAGCFEAQEWLQRFNTEFNKTNNKNIEIQNIWINTDGVEQLFIHCDWIANNMKRDKLEFRVNIWAKTGKKMEYDASDNNWYYLTDIFHIRNDVHQFESCLAISHLDFNIDHNEEKDLEFNVEFFKWGTDECVYTSKIMSFTVWHYFNVFSKNKFEVRAQKCNP